jgi:hypothetical protein
MPDGACRIPALAAKAAALDMPAVSLTDHGSLAGTIDLYKASRSAMRSWGVRRVDIDILEWGSKQESLKDLAPRKKNGLVRRMIAGIEANKS